MRLRAIVIGVLVIWGVFATAAFRNCGKPTPTGREPANPSLSSSDPSEVTQAYWFAARRVCERASKSMITREDLQRKAVGIKSLADGKRIYAELAQDYFQSAKANTEGARELKSLPTDRVDPMAVECVAELADFLPLQAALYQTSGEQVQEMAALFALIHAEGDAFDWDEPKGKAAAAREAEIRAKMQATAANEGAIEKRRLYELRIKIQAAETTLAKKHRRDFPTLFGKE